MARKRRTGAQRKRRSDYGTWKKSGRDQDGMRFVAQQKFVRLDTLAEFFDPGYARAVDPPKQQQEQDPSAEASEGPQTQPFDKKQRAAERNGHPRPNALRPASQGLQRLLLR